MYLWLLSSLDFYVDFNFASRDMIDTNNMQYSPVAEKILNEMLELLRQKAAELTSQEFFIIRIKLEESVQRLEVSADIWLQM